MTVHIPRSYIGGVGWEAWCGYKSNNKDEFSMQYKNIQCYECTRLNSRAREFPLWLDNNYVHPTIAGRTFKPSEILQKMNRAEYDRMKEEYIKEEEVIT